MPSTQQAIDTRFTKCANLPGAHYIDSFLTLNPDQLEGKVLTMLRDRHAGELAFFHNLLIENVHGFASGDVVLSVWIGGSLIDISVDPAEMTIWVADQPTATR